MPPSRPEPYVLDSRRPPAADEQGTTAVLTGMMSMLSEVLERLEDRLTAVEAAMAAPVSALLDPEQLSGAIGGAVEDAVRHAVAPLEGRLADMVQGRLDALESRVAGIAGSAGDTARRAEDSQMAAAELTRSLADRIDALGARLAEVPVTSSASTSAAVDRAMAQVADRLAGIEVSIVERGAAVVDAVSGEVRAAIGRQSAASDERFRGLLRSGEVVEDIVGGVVERLRPNLEERDRSAADQVTAEMASVHGRLDGLHTAVEAAAARPPAEADGPVRGIAKSLARLEAGVAELRAEVGLSVQGLESRIGEMTASQPIDGGRLSPLQERLAGIETLLGLEDRGGAGSRPWDEPGQGPIGGPSPIVSVLDEVRDRLAQLESALGRMEVRDEARAAQLAADVQTALGAGVERLLVHSQAADDLLSGDVKAALARLADLGSTVGSVATQIESMADVVGRVGAEDRARPLLEALEAFSHEQTDAITSMHSSLSRRFDTRLQSLATTVDGLVMPNEVIGGIGASVAQLRNALDDHRSRAEEILEVVTGLGDAVAALPTEGAIRAEVDRISSGLEWIRTEGLTQAVAEVRRDLEEGVVAITTRQATTRKSLERVTSWLAEEQRRLESIQQLCQAVATSSEQSGAIGNRVAELVLEARSQMRGDVERLESAVQLAGVKQQQADHARLSQATAGVTEVIERETALLAQRVSALAGSIESIRSALQHQDDGFRAPVPIANGTG